MCNHEFIGTAEGVYCNKCGIRLTDKEYAEYLKPKKEKQAEEVTEQKKTKKKK